MWTCCKNVIETVNAMHRRQAELEKQASGRAFEDTYTLVESMKFGFDLQMYVKVSDDEHVKQLQVLECSSKDVIRGITVLSQGRLPQEFFSDSQLMQILSEVQTMVQKGHPNYALAAEHISHYRYMKLVTFTVGQQTHSLIATFPVLFKIIEDHHCLSLKLKLYWYQYQMKMKKLIATHRSR